MNTVYVAGHWKQVTDLSFQELKDLLDAEASDLREQGATNFYVDGVDEERGTIFLCGSRPQTVEEEKHMKAAADKRLLLGALNTIKRITGKEVKIED